MIKLFKKDNSPKRRPFESSREATMYFTNYLNLWIRPRGENNVDEFTYYTPIKITPKGVVLEGLGEVSFEDLFEKFVWDADTPVGAILKERNLRDFFCR